MSSTRIIIAGGFLGAGKTTLLWEAARKLMGKGLCAGLITNDQAPELVDSALLARDGVKVAEVSGSCFCCNFNGFLHAVQNLRGEIHPDVIIAEPVGSCTDLSATIIQPLKKFWKQELTVAPLSVLADPARLGSILAGGTAGLHPDAAYIYRKQLEESDIILITKTDLVAPEELATLKKRIAKAYPSSTIIAVSALTGEGIDQWLEEVSKRTDAGLRLADVDYDIYAHGEAVLGWLNGTVRLKAPTDTDWDAFTSRFLSALSEEFDRQNYSVGHVKIIAESGNQYVAGNLTGKAETLAVRGSVGSAKEIKLTVNARVETSPGELDQIVRDTLQALTQEDTLQVETLAWRFLMPGRPQPTHRFVEVV
ncbi:MAG: cobalamin synthesis protein P47K [Tannerellaceae bacterium]|jgi:G3E family GTPase|nr:cobalamin synthesis protein P47K [Tannerellaceae bacterium]